MAFAESAFYWGSFLVFPFVALLIAEWRKPRLLQRFYGQRNSIVAVFMALCVLFVWMRFVETQLLITRHTRIETGYSLKVAVVADAHLGVFKGEWFMQRIVDRLNELDVDLVVMPGDFTYYLKDMVREFSPLADLRHPAVAVMGNHDVGQPGEDVRDELRLVLMNYGVEVIDNQSLEFEDITLVGIGSRWANDDKVEVLERFDHEDKLLVVEHNPDTHARHPSDVADLTITGHTHCGQINIPGIREPWIPTEGIYDGGLTQEDNGQLFISCGTGEVGVPMRLMNPPVVDVLELY